MYGGTASTSSFGSLAGFGGEIKWYNIRMNYSLTYLAIAILTALGVENAESVANAAMIVAAAVIGLYGRYRAGGINRIGVKQ